MTEVQTTIQALATVESLMSDIDALYVLDQQAKSLADKVKAMKDDIANKYGEGEHKGELHSVTVKMVAVKGTVDYGKLCVQYGIQDSVLDTFRKEGRADIRVTPTK
jgi:DNA-binding protein YbaB